MKFWEIIYREWKVLIGAPFSFILTLVSAIAAACLIGKFRYGKIIDLKDEEMRLLEREIKEKNAQIHSLEERTEELSDKVGILEIRTEQTQQYRFTDTLDSLHQKVFELRKAKDSEELEEIANDISRIPLREIVDVLLYRLCDWRVNEDPDTEDAFCSALTKFGLMKRLGNQRFIFREIDNMQPYYIRELLDDHRGFIPHKYFQDSQILEA